MGVSDLDRHRLWLEGFAERHIRPYLERAESGPAFPSERKEFNDPVWGTLQVLPEEVAILDSPLLQRLRRVRQLGVVHFVYPGATHSRLEHSLGALHQVQRLITTLNNGGLVQPATGMATTQSSNVVDESWIRTLRLAALCHDIGHGAMSHVSEYGLEQHRGSQNIRLDFQQTFRAPAKKQLSEIAAYYILGSPAFADLTQWAAASAGLAPIPDLGSRLQKLVLGTRVNDNLVLLHELISGPFDADKLDYITRDALMCGVPIVTDVPRLVQKIRATVRSSQDLPPLLKSKIQASPGGHLMIGVARSGGRSIDELALARTLMFDKVYRHQKVRAAEAMVSTLVRLLAELTDSSEEEITPAAQILELVDEDLLTLDTRLANPLTGISESVLTSENATARVVRDLSRRLRDRELFSRGFAFAPVMTGDHYRNDLDHSAGLKQLLSECEDPAQQQRLVDEISAYVREIATLLSMEDAIQVPGGMLEAYICVSPPKPAPKTSNNETGHAHLIDDDGHVTQFQEDSSETMPWADAYIATRDLGHVFCPRPMAPLVFLATEAIVRERYLVRVPESMRLYAKQDIGKIDALKRRLDELDWYAEKPADLRPLPAILQRADAEERLARIVETLSGYSGPLHAGGGARSDVPPSTVQRPQVIAFLQQFASDSLIDSAIDVLSNVRVIRREDMAAALREFATSNPDFHGAACVPVGTVKDSGSVMAYYVGDVAREFGIRTAELADALNGPQPLVFVDDFIGTGRQLLDIFEAWLGVERTADLGEERVALAPGLAEELRGKRIGIVVAAGRTSGADYVKSGLQKIGVNVEIHIHRADSELPTVMDALPNLERRSEFCKYVGLVAEMGLREFGGEVRTQDWIAERRLGYGNSGLLVASTFNTPTATLTALWLDSGSRWQSLLPRRKKD